MKFDKKQKVTYNLTIKILITLLKNTNIIKKMEVSNEKSVFIWSINF